MGVKLPRRKRTTGLAPAAAIKAESKLELTLAMQIAQSPVVPEPVREYRFHPTRKWRVDFAFLDRTPPLAVEVEGGTWRGNGRHSRGAGFEADCLKYNALSLAGWVLLRFTASMVNDGRAIAQLEELWRKS